MKAFIYLQQMSSHRRVGSSEKGVPKTDDSSMLLPSRGGLFCCGYTLVELLIALVILAVLTTTAVFFFSGRNASANPAFELYQDLQLARSEAIKRQTQVMICPTDASHQCTFEWNQSYKIYLKDKDKIIDLKHTELVCDRITCKTSLNQPIIFSSSGMCLQQGSLWIYKRKAISQLIFLRSGRIRIVSTQNT